MLKNINSIGLRLTLTVLINLFLFSSFSHAAKPTFKCKKLKSSVEKLVCKDGKLGELDRKMRKHYKSALKKTPKTEVSHLKATQRGWVKGRNDCWKAEDQQHCVELNYESRITELQIIAGDVVVPKEVAYDCGDNQRISAYFYSNTQLPAAVFNFVPERITTFLSPSGSGAKYEGQNVTFWTKGKEAEVTWKGMKLKCKEVQSSNE